MSRSFVLGLSAVIPGLLAANIAGADNTANPRASVVIRAHGSEGSIEYVRRTSSDALPASVEAGVIPRTVLRAELADGVGRFLQHVRTEAVLSHGHFIGWRLLSLFPKRPEVHVQVLKVGDILLRVNGQSVERPEAFKAVWDSLDTAKELVLDIERNGDQSQLRYTITEG